MRGFASILSVLAVAALTIASAEVRGQSATVAGTVREVGTREALPNTDVFIEGSSLGTLTNLDGRFVLLSAPDGPFTLVIRRIGYSEARLDLVGADVGEPVQVELRVIPLAMDSLVVSLTAHEIVRLEPSPSKVSIAPEQLRLLPNIGEVDIFRSLQLLPGVSGTNEGSSGLFVRGGTPDQNLVLLDGMTVYHVDHFFGFFSAFNANAIKDVQVWKGGFPARFGGRTSSVVQLTGKAGDPESYHVSLNANLLSGGAVVEVPLRGRGSIVLTGRRSYTDLIRSGLYEKIFNTLSGDAGAEPATQAPAGFAAGGVVLWGSLGTATLWL